MVRKIMSLLGIACVVALIHACSLNNNILIPDCEIDPMSLPMKSWVSTDSIAGDYRSFVFHSDGTFSITEMKGQKMKYEVDMCDNLHVTNLSDGQSDVWNIISLTTNKMTIRFSNELTLFYEAKGVPNAN